MGWRGEKERGDGGERGGEKGKNVFPTKPEESGAAPGRGTTRLCPGVEGGVEGGRLAFDLRPLIIGGFKGGGRPITAVWMRFSANSRCRWFRLRRLPFRRWRPPLMTISSARCG